MPIRFPDLQILAPRAADIGRVQPGGSEQAHINHHAQATQAEQDRLRRRQTLSSMSESARAAIKRENEKRRGSRQKGGSPRQSDGKGERIDLEA